MRNPGFEDPSSPGPAGWTVEEKVLHKGRIEVAPMFAHSGRRSLRLAPNQANEPSDIGSDPLAVGQGFPAEPLRGERLHVSAWLAARGGATAVVALLAVRTGGGALSVELRQDSPSQEPVLHEGLLEIPDDDRTRFVVLLCLVQGTEGAAHYDDVCLRMVPSPPPAGQDHPLLEARVEVDAAATIREIPRTLYGTNIEWIWDGNGLWDPSKRALRPVLVERVREAALSLVRFPGGIFADFYHWRDGIGPPAERPRTKHMPGGPSSVHVFGTEEALEYASRVGARLLITVNGATGTAEEAAEWVRYVNRPSPPVPGRRVDLWEVGNEIYVRDGSPQARAATMPPARYAARFREYARAMRAVDPGIKLGAIAEEHYSSRAPVGYPDWTETVLAAAGGDMDFLAVHNAYAPVLSEDPDGDPRSVYEGLLAAPLLIRDSLADLSRRIESLAGDREGRIRIAVTEWGPLFHYEPTSRFVDHVKTLGSALYVASTLKVFLESPRTDIANFFQLVDSLFIGWIGPRAGDYIAKAPLLALEMYTRYFGSTLVAASVSSPTYRSPPVGLIDAVPCVPYLEAVASRSPDGGTLYLLVINKHFVLPIKAKITIKGFRPAREATAWTLSGTGLDANTGTELFKGPGVRWARQAEVGPERRFHMGAPDEVEVRGAPVEGVTEGLEYSFPPRSVTSLEIPAAPR